MAPSTSRAFASWTSLDLTSRISWPPGIAWILLRLKAPVVNPFPYVYVHISPALLLRDSVVTFSRRLSSVVGGFSTLSFGLRPEGKPPSVHEILGMPPECDDSLAGDRTLSQVSSSSPDTPTTDNSTKVLHEKRESNKNRRESVHTRDLISFTHSSLCARWLETKLVKQHPHVETWTFQHVYKVPLARPCLSVRTVFHLPLNDLSFLCAVTFFSQVLVQI